MRVVSWNVNSLKQRLPLVLVCLDRHRPDVLCLQETKSASAAFPHAALRDAGYVALEHSEGRWNGVALVVREDLEVAAPAAGLPGAPSPEEARWLEATIGGVRVVTAYVPHGRTPQHPRFVDKLAFLDAMAEQLRRLAASGPMVVASDVNVAPEDRDVWKPAAFEGRTHVTPEERTRFRAILDVGLTDAFRAVAPDAVGFTWWDHRPWAVRAGLGMRLDVALVSHHLDVRACAVDVDLRRPELTGDKPSDHAPLVVDLARRGA